MRLLSSDPDKGEFKIRITDEDDLWYLYQVIGRGCVVGAQTFRKLESREDHVRPDNQPRVRVFLRIEVETVEFHPFTQALRISGRIVEGPPDMGGHHTFNIEPGSTLELNHPGMSTEEFALLEEAVSSSRVPKSLALVVDDESAQLFKLREYGLEPLGTIRAEPGGKMYPSAEKWEHFMKELSETLLHFYKKGIPVIITGPGFFKEKVGRALREEGHAQSDDILILSSSSGGISGLKEALISGGGSNDLISRMRFARESSMVDKLMMCIGKGKGGTYGLKEVRRALEMGAVDTLLITESVFRKDVGKELLRISERMGSTHHIISLSHEGGKMLDKLGGVGALLRYDLH
ncbi:MAG TPA: mRNA surveillance protein pelota [Euryarchaeota archaeon]|nr:mRNA surveillance protein pelota [Euryarchaeota archaeon]